MSTQSSQFRDNEPSGEQNKYKAVQDPTSNAIHIETNVQKLRAEAEMISNSHILKHQELKN